MVEKAKASEKSPPFSPNVQTFLTSALPPGRGGHVLVIGESHVQTESKKYLTEKWPALSNTKNHNVGTLGLEHDIYENVILWAMQDNKLPVSKDKYPVYLNHILKARARPQNRPTIDGVTEMIVNASANGIKVVAYDVRDFESTHADIKTEIPLDKSLDRNALRTDDAYFEKFLSRSDSTVTAAGSYSPRTAWVFNEIKEILDHNPEYVKRLEAIKKIVSEKSNKGVGEDGQSAEILKYLAAPNKNVVVLAGGVHMNGMQTSDVQGTFVAHVASKFQKATPVIMATSGDLAKMGEQLKNLQEGYRVACTARAPMNLVVPDVDLVLDVSNSEAAKQGAKDDRLGMRAKSLAQNFVNSGLNLTCDQPELPTSAACAKQETEGKGSCKLLRR